ncbi:MAG: energy-coupling factor transporter transmembrane component T family protein [Spirochaetaceae bacterium]
MNKTLLGYVPDASIIYKVHPSVKVLFLLVVSLFPMFISAVEWNAALIVVLFVLLLASKVDLKTLKIYVPVAISMGMIILLSYTVLGGRHQQYNVIATPLGIPIYWERLRDALVVYFRILPMILTMVFFLSTTREREIVAALRSVRIPFVITYVLAMSMRAAGMVLEDFRIVRQAEQARGFDTKGKSLPYKIRKYVMYMIPLFALSLRRSEEFTNALLARGYSFRTNLRRPDYILTRYRFAWWDGVASLLIVALFLALLYGRYLLLRFTVEDSAVLTWLQAMLLPGGLQ